MSVAAIQCPACRNNLPDGLFNQPDPAPCPACNVPIKVELFPAFFRSVPAGNTGETVIIEGESNCFFHSARKAVIPCQTCGRFLCSLCDCELRGEHFCPSCLESGKTKGKIRSLDSQRVRYDRIALALTIYPVVLLFGIYFTVVTAPLALFVALRYWKAPMGIVQRNRARSVIAIIFALLQITAWILLIGSIFYFRPTTHG